ncbi:kinesin-like protein KIFC3 isoform X4 [Acipenser oxyrinchus oxyrinchus]|uniref:Kinesin-like protein KIFC3 n=1 Tax=Acipenser oxyrinchus oxyrinchus TaxID=40147 RepID=A0AAD8D1L7_ACIOX|nr:kinesin-like protein KIFC3 isoform X4 [Acipenser oxyrinchus oxyrinchus]
MYVLCTLVVLSLQSLFKGRSKEAVPGSSDQESPKKGSGPPKDDSSHHNGYQPKGGCNNNCGAQEECRTTSSIQSTPKELSRREQPAQRQHTVFKPGVMLGTRKTWDLGHAPSLQELWKKDCSLDRKGVDFLMGDGEEQSSTYIPLQSSLFQSRTMTTDHQEPNNEQDQQLVIQALQEKVCQFQARLRSEEASRKLQVQLMRKAHEQNVHEKLALIKSLQEVVCEQESQLRKGNGTVGRRSSLGSRPAPSVQRLVETLTSTQEEKNRLQEDLLSAQERLCSRESEQQALIRRLQDQVEDLKEKLLDQAGEVNRLRSELGATDLEKHLEILESENEQLKQELSVCQSSLQELQGARSGCVDCQHNQEGCSGGSRPRSSLPLPGERAMTSCRMTCFCAQDLRAGLAQLEAEVGQKDLMLAELQQGLERKASQVSELNRQLEDSRQQRQDLEDRLRDCQQALAKQATQVPQVQYVTKTVEVESSRSKQALSDALSRNQYLQEQVGLQRQLLRELEQQLQDSHNTATQLRKQIMLYESEIERTQGELVDELQCLEEEKNRVIEEAFVRAESEMKAVHENLAGVRMNLLTLQPALRTLTCDYNCLKRQVQDFPFLLEKAIGEAKQEICQVIGEVSATNQDLLSKYKREMMLRKKCHNELVKLKGNIRVFCRVRPLAKEDGDGPDSKNVVTFDPEDDALMSIWHKGKPIAFELDKVFPPQATQGDVFQEVQSLITSCIDGYNVCIFAYGQTGSGKTYTMEGIPQDPGINQRALRLLFSEVEEKVSDWEFTITVSMVEIYNETLRNLLGDNPNEKLDIKMCPDGSGQLYVPGLTEFKVESVDDINRVFELGHMNRATACTNLNDHSSRSHGLLIVTVSGINCTTGGRSTGKLNLVDLAGSERIAKSGAEGSRLREAQCINKSLAALADVIHALRSKHGHIPFRNSKLTYLLQDSLSGDSKTLMMVQVSPVDKNVSESVCSLKFAQRVRSVELGPATRRAEYQSSTSSSPTPTQENLEVDSPPATPMPTVSTRGAVTTFGRTGGSTRRKLPPSVTSNI